MLEKELKEETNDIFHFAVFSESYYKTKCNYSSRKKNNLDYNPEERYEKYNSIVETLNGITEEDIRERFDENELYNEEVSIKEKFYRLIDTIRTKI